MLSCHRMTCLGLLFGLILLAGLEEPAQIPVAQSMPRGLYQPPECSQTLELPGPTDQGELTELQKTAAFAEVLAGASYGDYRFGVKQTAIQTTTVLPVLLKSMAGIETTWQQYQFGQTLIKPHIDTGSCDMGMLQINDRFSSELFKLQPSLRSDTRGNIAAAAQRLVGDWNRGIVGNLPVVNDSDPDWLPNWYYALSSYNGGPSPGNWANNPNCSKETGKLACSGESFDESRGATQYVIWPASMAATYPYQERIFYNLAFPSFPDSQQWLVGGLGFKQSTSATDHGIRPDDEVFLHEGRSFAPNLLLFRHRASPVQSGRVPQLLTVEYQLPFEVPVRLNIVRNGVLLGGQECRQTGKAGWNTLSCLLTLRLQTGDAYRLRAELGSKEDLTSYYLGQYAQQLNMLALQAAPLMRRINLPVVVNRPTGPSLLLNGTFERKQPDQPQWPDYWDIQVINSREDLRAPLPVTSTLLLTSNPTQLVFQATPRGRIDLRQTVHIAERGTYELSFVLTVRPGQSASRLLVRTRPAKTGANVWSTIVSIPAGNITNRRLSYPLRLDGPAKLSFMASFSPTDRQTQFLLSAVRLRQSAP